MNQIGFVLDCKKYQVVVSFKNHFAGTGLSLDAGCWQGALVESEHPSLISKFFTKFIGGESRNIIVIAGEWKDSLDVTQIQALVKPGAQRRSSESPGTFDA